MNTLKYALFDNPLAKKGPVQYIAIIQNPDVLDMEMLTDEMAAEGTGLTRPQTKAYIEKLFQLIKGHAAMGRRIKLPIVNIHSSIRGVFTNKDDSFDPTRHHVVMLVSPGLELRRLEKEIKPEKVKGVSPMPELHYINDVATGEHNRTATPGSVATLKGYHLKFDPADPLQGLFFVPEANHEAALRVTQFTRIKPSELNFLVPALAAGNYHVEVRTYISRGKQLRTGSLTDLIEVL